MALPDEAFTLNHYIKPDRIMPDGKKAGQDDYAVQQSVYVKADKQSVYVNMSDFADESALMRFDADDAERLGVLLQYAAMKARENGEQK